MTRREHSGIIDGMKVYRIVLAGCAIAAVPLAAAAMKSFPGPSSWTHVAATTSGATVSQDVWKSSDGPSADVLAVMTETTMKYDDVLAAVHSNVAAGGIKLSLDKDMTCAGDRAHNFEMSFGPDGKKTLVNQTIIADGTGTTRITYTRADGKPFSDDVKTAVASYCGS